MTVTYQTEVASIRSFGVFWKLLFRWKGSIYKLVWPDLSLYIVLYFTLNMSYRFAMNEHHRQLFEEVSRYCANFSTFIPMSFVLGFYVTIVVNRWWEQYLAMPWPDPLAVFVSTNIHGNDDRGRLIRRTIMRYVNLSFVYTMSQVCTRVKKRFPTLDHLVEAGIMTDTEKKIFELMNKKTPHLKYWMPLVWAGSIVTKARKEGRIRDDFAVKTLVDAINTFRSGLGSVLNYDWISVPLVYTQTVTLAVYTFFIAELMGRQFVKGNEPDHQTIDLYVPIFTFLQFFFYMGWLRVAETLFNPFGDDDDDFEINWMIDRNLQVSYIIVDEMHEDHPELVRDQYWEDVIPSDLPYTVAAEQYRREPPQGSAAQIDIKRTDMLVSDAPATIPEEDEIRTLVTPKDVEAAQRAVTPSPAPPPQSSVIADALRPPASLAVDIGGSGSPGAGGEPPMSPAAVGSATNSLESRLSGAMPAASLKRSVRGLISKISNRVRVSDTPTNMLVTRSSSRTSNDSHRTNPPHSPLIRGEDEMFVMSDLDLAAGSRGSIHADSGGAAGEPLLGRALSVPESDDGGVPPQRRLSGGSSDGGSEERNVPKFLPGDYNFMITTVPEEDEAESEETAPAAEPPPQPPPPAVPTTAQLANVLSTTFHPQSDETSDEQQAGQQSLLTQLITTIIEAAGGTVQPRPPVPSPPPSLSPVESPVPVPFPAPDAAPAASAEPADRDERRVQFATKSHGAISSPPAPLYVPVAPDSAPPVLRRAAAEDDRPQTLEEEGTQTSSVSVRPVSETLPPDRDRERAQLGPRPSTAPARDSAGRRRRNLPPIHITPSVDAESSVDAGIGSVYDYDGGSGLSTPSDSALTTPRESSADTSALSSATASIVSVREVGSAGPSTSAASRAAERSSTGSIGFSPAGAFSPVPSPSGEPTGRRSDASSAGGRSSAPSNDDADSRTSTRLTTDAPGSDPERRRREFSVSSVTAAARSDTPQQEEDRSEAADSSLMDDSSGALLLPGARHRRRHDTDSSDEPAGGRQSPPSGADDTTPFY